MEGFHRISHEELENVCHLFDKDWALITAGKEAEVNTMTASWGGIGILWNRPVVFCFIRPQRHTFTLTERHEHLSLSFLPEQYRAALRLCGSKSGRDTDKFAAAGLTPAMADHTPYVAEARLVLLCRKLYADDLKKASFLDPVLLENYKAGDFHRMYICEIEGAYLKDEAKG